MPSCAPPRWRATPASGIRLALVLSRFSRKPRPMCARTGLDGESVTLCAGSRRPPHRESGAEGAPHSPPAPARQLGRSRWRAAELRSCLSRRRSRWAGPAFRTRGAGCWGRAQLGERIRGARRQAGRPVASAGLLQRRPSNIGPSRLGEKQYPRDADERSKSRKRPTSEAPSPHEQDGGPLPTCEGPIPRGARVHMPRS